MTDDFELRLQQTIHEHTFSEERRWFTATLTCSCGLQHKLWIGMFYPTAKAFVIADHWAAIMGVRKWRTLEEIRSE